MPVETPTHGIIFHTSLIYRMFNSTAASVSTNLRVTNHKVTAEKLGYTTSKRPRASAYIPHDHIPNLRKLFISLLRRELANIHARTILAKLCGWTTLTGPSAYSLRIGIHAGWSKDSSNWII